MTTDLATQAGKWVADRDSIIKSRDRLLEEYGMPVSYPPEHLVAQDLPEPLRSEVLKQLSR